MVEPPPELAADGPPPGAAWFRQLLAFCKSLRVTLDADSGIVGTAGPNGTSIGISLDRPIYHAQTTSTVSARSGATMGSGTFQLYVDDGATGGTMLVAAGLPDQTGYSISGTSFGTGVWCLVARVNGRWKFVSADCSGAA